MLNPLITNQDNKRFNRLHTGPDYISFFSGFISTVNTRFCTC